MKNALRSFLFIFITLTAYQGYAQYDACANAVSHPVSLPYSAGGQTTCGMTDDFDGTISCTNPASYYTTGPDVFYAFTASSTGHVTITFTTSATYEYPSVIVFQGCPSSSTNATNCVAGTSTSSGNMTLGLSVTAGQTYVVMIDNWVTPSCLSTYGLSISSITAPTPGDACSSPISVTAPYCGTGQTTCGFYDDFDGTVNCASPSSFYTTGPDVFYSFTPTTGGLYQIQLTNTSPTYYYGSITVFQGCPSSASSATNCVAGTSVSSGNLGLTFNATSGVTYYVMIDNEPTPSCFNYDICIQAAPTAPLQGACTNLGYESGTTGWFGTVGTISSGGITASSPVYNVSTFNTFTPQTSVITAGTDPIGGFPLVFAGSQSLRIGDGTGTNYGGASVEQYFQVTSTNSNFTYNYAVVLEDGGHSNYDQPFFQVEVFDQNGNSIPCGNYLITAPGTGFVQSTVTGYSDTWYKPWTTVSLNLLSYVGQNVKVRFTSGDCSQGGHFGYAYVDCSCASYTISPITICQGSTGTLTAPSGAMSYSWAPGGATTNSISVNPSSTTAYTCTITSQGNTPCPGSLTTTVTVLPIPVVTATSVSVCPGQGGNLTASGATSYTWSPATGLSSTTGATVTATPASTTAYTVTGSNGTCSSTGTATATVVSPPTVTVNSPTICKGNSTSLTASGASTYSWSPSTGLSATTGASVTANPTVTTTYTVVGTTGSCTASATSLVTVNPLPTVTVNSPTICAGTSSALNASGATTYSWSPATGLSATTGSTVTANPTATTTYTITGTTSSCTSTATSIVTVNPLPTVTVNSPTICKGSSTSLTASGATTYSWSPSTGLSATTGASVTANPTVTTTYTVVGTTSSCTATATSVVTVNPLPTVTVNSPTICAGTSTALNASGATTYSWSPSTGLSATTGSTVTANPAATTTYTVVGTTSSCTASVTSIVTVNPLPTVTVNSPTICKGSSTTLTASGATSYSWSPSTGLSSTSGATVTANPTVTTTYTITGTTSSCTSTATSIVTVNPLPTVTVNSPSICVGGTTTLTASGATTYSWSPSTGLSATSGSTITANPGSTTVYTVTGTTSGCNGTASSTVTINPTPTVTVNSPNICPGATATLTASGANTYTWSPSGTLSASTGATVQATPTVTTVYTITATSTAGCTTTATSSVTIAGSITPVVPSATICAGTSTTLSATGGSTYTWSPGTGLSSTSGSTVTANPAATTSYTITAASGGCTGTTTAMVTVNPLPTVTVNSPSICVGGSTALTASGASTYSWSPATGLSATSGASVTANPTVTTSYTVVGTTATCTAQAVSVVTVNPLPVVSVTSGSYCAGGSATLTASGANTYTWSPTTGLSSSTGASVTANPTGTTNYTVTATSSAGCVSTGTTSVTVAPNPTVTVASATICLNNSTPLTANGATTYTWSPATGLSSSTGSSVTANPTSTTTYTISGTTGTCTNSTTAVVTVNPLPVITVNSATICVGQQTATLTASGASTYTWSPSTGLSSSNGSPVTATPASSTSYTVTGTDGNGCINSATTAVTVNPLPTINVNNGTICVGDNLVLTASGANTYSWSPGTDLSATTGASVTANPTVTTTYTVTGTSTQGCINTNTTTVTVVTTPTVVVASATICIGSSTTLSATGATTYTWSPATGLSSSTGSSVTANPTVTTTYTITGTAGTCTDVTTAVVTVNPLPVISATSGTICVGQQTATLTASGASTYTWSPATGLSSSNGSPVTATPSTSTPYTVTGTDANGCVSSATTAVTVNPLPTITLNSGFICNGSTAPLTAGGASTYTWSPATGLSSTTGSNVNANPASTTQYTVTGTDANGCVNSDTTSVTVVSNPTVTVASATICIGSSTTLTATGASTYAWSPSTGLSSSTGSSVTANPTVTTSYTITGTAGTCTDVTTAVVTVNPLPVISATSGTICVGQQTATLTASGASTYTWSPSTGLSSSNGSPVTSTPSTSTPYTVTGTDANGCVSSATTAVTVNPLPTITLNSGFICNGSTAPLTAGGASTYTWSPATGLSSTTGSNVNANPASTTQYTVTGTDANGCVNSDTTSVTVVSNPTVTVASATICIGSSTTLTATGASTYAWSPSTGLSSSTGSSVTANPTVTTTYTITGTAGTCTDVTTAVVTVNPLPTITASSSTICVGQQTATLTASGGSTYTWSPSASLGSATGTTVTGTPTTTTIYTVTGTDGNGCVNTGTTSITVNSLPILTLSNGFICVGGTVTLNAAGASTYTWSPATGLNTTTGNTVDADPTSTTNYTVNATDANGCTNSDTTTVTVVTNPTVTVLSSTICIGASATLTANGANTYTWTPSSTLSSSTGTSVVASPTTTTVYTITGTAGTCTDVTTATVTVNPLPTVVASSNGPRCVTWTLSLTSSGGTSYSWAGPNGFASTNQNDQINNVTTANAGVYTVTVTDANGCVNTDTANVVINPLPVVTATGATVCIGQTINLSCAPTGTGFSYSWNNPVTGYTSNQQNPSITNSTTSMSGSYVITITDNNGCASGNVANVVVNPALSINAVNNGPICEGATLVLATGAGVSWSWSGPNGFASTSQSPTIAGALTSAGGTYTVVGTDANGCTGTATTTAIVNPLPVITVNSGTICATQGSASLVANGGQTYTWSPASSLSSANGSPVSATPLITTVYTVSGTDGNSCVNSATTTVTVNQLPTVAINSAAICIGNTATLTATGASSYTFNPSTGLGSATMNPASASPSSTTTYTVIGQDANGCYNAAISTVTVNPLPVVGVNSATVCSGATATLNATGANTYAWSPTAGLNSASGASVSAQPANSSSYLVTGTDINGCANTATAVVTVNPLPAVEVGPPNSGCAPVCVNLANTTSATGTCSWVFGDGNSSSNCTPTHCFTGQGTFNSIFTLTDANGCVGKDTVITTVYPVPHADFTYGPIPATVLQSTINFYNNSSGAVISTWQWTFGDPGNHGSTLQNPMFNYGDPGTYPVTLAVSTSYGCADTVTKYVVIGEDYMLYVPNAFSPNFDGVNDVFMAKGEGIKEFKMYIFDRWGNMVFFSDDLYKGWDGRFQSKGEEIVQEDVYVWKIEAKDYKGEPHLLKGTVTLLK